MMNEGFHFATFSPAFVASRFVYLCHSGWVEMKFQSWFNLNSVVKNVEHILRYLLAIVISSIMNTLSGSIAHFLIESFALLTLCFDIFVYSEY